MQADAGQEQIGWRRYGAWAAILLLAAALRIPGISPDIAAWHPDEYNFVFWPLLILLGEHTPPVFYYPHLSYYLLAAINAVHLAIAGTGDSFTASALLRYFWYPEQSLALARAVGVVCAVATVGATRPARTPARSVHAAVSRPYGGLCHSCPAEPCRRRRCTHDAALCPGLVGSGTA